jgi:threonine/homoserine/homoserine lactone efflux protein
MVSASHVLAFAAVVTVLIAIPGPSVLFTISRALTVGRRAALLTVAGNEIGLYVQVIAVAFGVSAVVEQSAEVLTAVKLAGAAYLVYLPMMACFPPNRGHLRQIMRYVRHVPQDGKVSKFSYE